MIPVSYSSIAIIGASFCVLCVMVAYIYLKLSYGFWFYQPVFHLYDFYYYLFPCGIVEKQLPDKNKFTNLTDIDMRVFSDVQANHLFSQFVSFIGSHYMRNQSNNFVPSVDDTSPYFTNHKHPCFISYYYKNQLLQNTTNTAVVSRKQIIGTMTTRPVQIEIRRSSTDVSKMYAYYVDYLCVHRDHRSKGVAPQLIQTHYYHQRRRNPAIHANLFKREGELTGIVPLCVYSSLVFDILSVVSHHEIPPIYKRIRCTSQNSQYLIDFAKHVKGQFDITICPDLSNLLDLVNSETYYIDYIVDTTQNNDIIACYVFKKTCVTIDKKKNVIACIASIRTPECPLSIFIDGFKTSLTTFLNAYTSLIIEELSHNAEISNNLKSIAAPHCISPTAYFFHNFVYPTFSPSKVFILGT